MYHNDNDHLLFQFLMKEAIQDITSHSPSRRIEAQMLVSDAKAMYGSNPALRTRKHRNLLLEVLDKMNFASMDAEAYLSDLEALYGNTGSMDTLVAGKLVTA